MNLDIFSYSEVLSTFLVLFGIIDIPGNVPIFLGIEKKVGKFNAFKISGWVSIIMAAFFFGGEEFLRFFHIKMSSFAIAGSILLLILGLEILLNITIMKVDFHDAESASVVPLAFPMIAGPGSLTMLTTLKTQYHSVNVMLGCFLNVILIYFVLRYTGWIAHKLEKWLQLLHKLGGILVLSMGIEILRKHLLQ